MATADTYEPTVAGVTNTNYLQAPGGPIECPPCNRTHLFPDDIDALKALLAEQFDKVRALREERLAWRAEREVLQQAKHEDKNEIVRLTLLLAKLKRMLFGQKS